jgi:uncharacterized protein
MNAPVALAAAARREIEDRIAASDWDGVSSSLDARGNATLERLLFPDECRALAALYAEDQRFRNRVVTASHGYGRGEYKYFAYPLPEIVADLRAALYPRLAPIANRWNASMRIEVHYPQTHAEFLARCHASGQGRPTPLLLQ